MRHSRRMSARAQKYYFNTRTGEVEVGRKSPWTRRMGPYGSYAEAAQALETAAERNAQWDEEDDED